MYLDNLSSSTIVDNKSEKNFSEKVKNTVKAIPLAVSLAIWASCVPAEANYNNNLYNYLNEWAYQVEIGKFSANFWNRFYRIEDIIADIQIRERLPLTYRLDSQTVNILNEKYYPFHVEVSNSFDKSINFLRNNSIWSYWFEDSYLFNRFGVKDKYSLFFAIKDFQEKNDIVPDWILWQNTYTALDIPWYYQKQSNNNYQNQSNSNYQINNQVSNNSEKTKMSPAMQKFAKNFNEDLTFEKLSEFIETIQRFEGMEVDGKLWPKTAQVLEEKYYPKVDKMLKWYDEWISYLTGKYNVSEIEAEKFLFSKFRVDNYFSLYFMIRYYEEDVYKIKPTGSFWPKLDSLME